MGLADLRSILLAAFKAWVEIARCQVTEVFDFAGTHVESTFLIA